MVQLLQGGTVSQSYSYNAYGYINADEYGIQAPFYGYNGEQYDPSTGLQYLRARYYAPQNGSFISQDSFAGLLTDALSQNQYTYVQNNPVNYIDPTGHVAKLTQPVTKTSPSVTGKSTTSAVTKTTQSSQAKKTVTAIPTASALSSASTYASGAAKAAQSAKMGSTVATSTAVTASVAKNSYATVTKAAGHTKLTPTDVTQSISNIAKFTRHTCNSSSNTVSLQSGRKPSMSFAGESIPLDPDILTLLWEWVAEIAAEEGRAVAAGVLAASDGPLPYGDAIALGLLLYDFAVDASGQITIEHKRIENSKFFPEISPERIKEILGAQSASANPSLEDSKDGKSDDGNKTPEPSVDYPGDDPTAPPGEDWEWRGRDEPSGERGAWYNPKTRESLKPDLNHEPPVGPHWDYEVKGKPHYRWYPNGEFELN